MKRAYSLIRGVGYACGIAAVLLILGSGRGEGDASRLMEQIGYLLLLVMFVFFAASYVLYALIRGGR